MTRRTDPPGTAELRAHRVADVRAAETVRLAQVPEGALMQRAAAGLAAACAGVLRDRRGRVTGSVLWVLAGAGNNGGDALYAGARLAGRGASVTALLVAPQVHPGGLAALLAAGGRAVAGRAVARRAVAGDARGRLRPDLVIDGLVGLGGTPGLREPAASLVAGLPAGVPVVAVDLPSGVDPDTGETPAPHVRADLTVTFGALKPCLLLPPASLAAGQVVEVDIGLGDLLPDEPAVRRLGTDDVRRLWPVPGNQDDKYRRGVVGIVAGSPTYTGAAVLACGGALRAGAGMVRYVGPAEPTAQVRARWPETVFGVGQVQSWVLGSGVDPDARDGQAEAVERALGGGLPCVLDAGGLALVASRPRLRHRLGPHVLLTPHAGELLRLLEALGHGPALTRRQVEEQPLRHARRAAELTGAVVLLKGSTTLVVAPDGRVASQADAPSWLATAGAGDVLAGIAGTLLASGLDPVLAGALAALAHGRAAAAASGGGPLVAQDVAEALPGVVAACLGSGGL